AFFLQAEDGIRDFHVTGVQTCALPISAKLAMTEARLMDAHEKPSGELRVTATVGLGANWLTPRIREFIELYPGITVNLILADRRSEERRVGKECRCRGAPAHGRQNGWL